MIDFTEMYGFLLVRIVHASLVAAIPECGPPAPKDIQQIMGGFF